MTHEEYLQYHKNMCDKMQSITKSKNHDYAGFCNDAFANFKLVELCGIASVEQGFLTRISDKLSRINSFIKQSVLNVKDESIEDTLLDLANYAILMAGYIKDKKRQFVTNVLSESSHKLYTTTITKDKIT